jgi:mannose-6-phosphate isomerase
VQLSQSRRLLAQSPYFVLEHIDLPANSQWEIDVEEEVWVLPLAGEASFDLLNVSVGQAVFLDAQSAHFRAGRGGLKGLVAYVASEPLLGLLRHNEDVAGGPAKRRPEIEELPT